MKDNASYPPGTKVSRRRFLRQAGLAAAGMGAGLLVGTGCSSSAEPEPYEPPTPNYVNAALAVTDVFTGQAIPSGHVTFPDGNTVPIRDGLAEVTEAQKLLAGTYRVLVQGDSEGDFVTHSREIKLVDEQTSGVAVLPWNHEQFSYEQMKDKFMFGDDFNRYTIRWADGSDITSYHYDESYFDNETLRFVRSDDPTMLASKFFHEDNIAAYRQVVDWIPASANITLASYLESEQEVEFARSFDNNRREYIFNAGEPNPPPGFLLVQGWNTDRDNTVINASLTQKAGVEGAPTLKAPGAVYSDSIENFGIRTTGNPGTVVDIEREGIWTPLAPLLITAAYSFAPGSGLYKLDDALPAKNGSELSVIEHYVPQ